MPLLNGSKKMTIERGVDVSPYVGCVVEYAKKHWVMDDKKGQTVWLRSLKTGEKCNTMYHYCKFVEATEDDYRKTAIK